MKSFLILVALSIISTKSLATELAKNWATNCSGAIAAALAATDKSAKQSKGDLRIAALTEKHQLTNLLENNAQFIKDHPSIVMNAAQRTLAVVEKAGVKEIPNPETGFGKVKYYNLFSEGSPLTDYKRVVGHYNVIERVMGNLDAAARGDTSGVYPVLIWGPPATGKTVFLSIPEFAFQKATLEVPEFYEYTFAWKNLDKVPQLEQMFNDIRGTAKDLEIDSPIQESPFTLLPKDIQDALLADLNPELSQKIKGYSLAPKREANSQDRFILDAIVKNLGANLGRVPTSLEVIDAVNEHVVLKRYVQGTDGTKFLIPAQTKDLDIPGLFMSKNPVAMALGTKHPFAYHITGLIPRANGGRVFFDEVGKNPSTLITKFLNLIQDRVVQEGGAPSVPVDFFAIMATNTKDIQNIVAADPQSPFMSRATRVMMPWHVHPQLIEKTLVYEMPNLTVKKLGDANASEVKAREVLDNLFPEVQFGQKAESTDGRYQVFMGEGANRTYFSPHALAMVADVVSLSRQKFDVTEEDMKAMKWPNVDAVPSMMRDPLTRIKAYRGETDVQDSVAMAYFRYSKGVGEGTFGFDHRDVTKWLDLAIQEAKKKDNNNVVSPLLLRRSLEKFLTQDPKPGEEVKLSSEDKVRLLNYMDFVNAKIIVPKIKEDIMMAMAHSSDQAATELYEKVVQAIFILNADPGAKEFVDVRTKSPVSIRKEELEAIGKIFKSQQGGRELSYSEIAAWHHNLIFSMRKAASEGEEGAQKQFDTNHPGLMSAISEYQATNVAKALSSTYARFVRIASGELEGTVEEIQRASEFIARLKNDRGYCDACIPEALRLMADEPGSLLRP